MSVIENLLAQLTAQAREADELHSRSRRMLVKAVRSGAANGLSQREIANAIGRSQPEVSRLLRFHGSTPRGKTLAVERARVLRTIRMHGGKNPRVFGSVAEGTDSSNSDIDLLVDFDTAMSLFELARLEGELKAILGSPVDVVSPSSLRPNFRQRVVASAIPL